jgi:DNA-binding MarR family transcriptional regulator
VVTNAKAPVPRPHELKEALGFVPLIEAYFRRGPSEMPPELKKVFVSHRLTARHGAVLVQLIAEQPLTVSELSRRLGVSLPTTSELVSALGRAELIDRAVDPANRRRALVSLAERHRPLVEAFVTVRAAPLLRVLHRLSPRDRQGFVAGLTAWAREVRD